MENKGNNKKKIELRRKTIEELMWNFLGCSHAFQTKKNKFFSDCFSCITLNMPLSTFMSCHLKIFPSLFICGGNCCFVWQCHFVACTQHTYTQFGVQCNISCFGSLIRYSVSEIKFVKSLALMVCSVWHLICLKNRFILLLLLELMFLLSFAAILHSNGFMSLYDYNFNVLFFNFESIV